MAESIPPPYAITTPVRNEMPVLPQLVACIDALVPRPALWLVVDDSSNDGSRQWLSEQAAGRPWMEVVDAPEQSSEYLGGHVARIKRWGLELALRRADERGLGVVHAGVLDADIDLPTDHYARLIAALEADPALGIVSSTLAVTGAAGPKKERLQREDLPRGPTQFFRRSCLECIGGLPPWPGFDGAANVKAQARGWGTRALYDVIAIHRRPTATRFGHAQGHERQGRYAWFLGVHPILVAVRVFAYSSRPPFTAGWYFFKGWLGCAVRREPRCPDPEIRRGYGIRRVGVAARAFFASRLRRTTL